MERSLNSEVIIKTGRAFYSIGIIVFGIQQIVIRDFRPEILPPFPAWAHDHVVFPFITGIALIIAGVIVSGLFKITEKIRRETCLYLGIYFLLLIIICHIPYNLIFSPNKAIHMGVWAPMLKELAYCGGAFVVARSYENVSTTSLLEKLIPFGRIFFSTTMIIYGYSHFLYTTYISQMVPEWFGASVFWTYVGGTALICAGVCIMLKIFLKPIAVLLAVMIFLWFIFLHIPDAVANPYLAHGNEIVSAFDALLFVGVALVIAFTVKTAPLAKIINA
jgi:uncharacterized membrane protein YphA (DoxX/SURF4 family)